DKNMRENKKIPELNTPLFIKKVTNMRNNRQDTFIIDEYFNNGYCLKRKNIIIVKHRKDQ
ncbi:TPA: hypothetical protein ACHY6W_005472, partial [Escherichia coli]